MRLGLLTATAATATTLALSNADDRTNASRSNSNNQQRRNGQRLMEQVLGDVRSRMLQSDGLAALFLQQQLDHQQPQQEGALWKTRSQELRQPPSQRSIYDYTTPSSEEKDEPDVGILAHHRHLDQETPSAGTIGEYIDYKFCDLFLELSAFSNMVCDCQNSPRARVKCQSPRACYESIDPHVCLSTHVDMTPRQDQATLNLQVCYKLVQPRETEYCFNTDMDYASFFLGNETLYESCFLTVDGEACNSCDITSWSQNDLNCTGLSDFDCSNTAAGSVATTECSMFYDPFPEISRIAGIVSDAGGGGGWNRRSAVTMGTSLAVGAVMAWGTTWL